MAKRKKRLRKSVSGGGGSGQQQDEGLLWVQEVQIRPKYERRAMSRYDRFKSSIKKSAKMSETDQNDDLDDPDLDEDEGTTPKAASRKAIFEEYGDSDDDCSDPPEPRQFTVNSVATTVTFWKRLQGIFCTYDDTEEYSYRPNSLFVSYINWTFQKRFMVVFVSFLVIFMFINFVFAGFLKLAGDVNPGCIKVSGADFGYNPSTRLADAFALSWTTFTTVGYGMIFTSTGTDYHEQHECSAVVFLCTTESFVGLLYAGMCAAILFGKVGRIQSHAQVKFSNALCISMHRLDSSGKLVKSFQPGPLLTPQSPSEVTPQTETQEKLPCPVLKFQVINKLGNTAGGEIMDANIRAVVGNKGATATISTFIKLQLAEFEHPFFSRVWQGRHVLDANSPMLTPFARNMVRDNDGYWPEGWNNPKSVRNALQFTDLIVILTGISNVSAATVHGYRRYKYGDVLVGYEFAPILFSESGSSKISIDFRLAHDVIEQTHGRAEPFGEEEDASLGSIQSQRSIRLLEIKD